VKILIINGPNLNMLGIRERSVYGTVSLKDIEESAINKARELDVEASCFQSNHEGVLIDRIHSAMEECVDGIIINPGGYTHTSVALRDALLSVDIPFIEVHISNVAGREAFRLKNLFSDIAAGTITGLGPFGYILAVQALRELYEEKNR